MADKPELSNSDLCKDIIKIYEPYFLMLPNYYQVFIELINNIIYKDNESSFSLQHKLFYGLMASSTVGCEKLLYDFEKIFLIVGGNKSWVEEGLKCKNIPEQIRGLATINNILAHKPWIMDWRHFTEFKNGLSVFLFQSAIILTSIQRFASILSSLNCIIQKKKEDEKNGKNVEKNDEKNEISDTKINEENSDKSTETIKKKKRQKSGNFEDEIEKVIISVKKSSKENKKNKNKNKNKNDEKEKMDKDIGYKKEIFRKYISEFIMTYNNFNPHIEKYLLVEDFNWKTNAKYFFFDYAGKEMEYLDKELKVLENITLEKENEKNDKKINIFKLRNAIEKYISLIFGINDDEYNYHLTNESIAVELKRVIKKIACYPDQISEIELDSCLKILTKEQLVYLIFIVTSIKQKISLTFFAKAFEDFMSNNKSLNNNNADN